MANITLSLDENLIADATAYAQAHDTTLDALIRDFLTQIAGPLDRKTAAEEYAKLALEQSGCSEQGWRFNREEIHKRGSWM
jgi:hypothetical protein